MILSICLFSGIINIRYCEQYNIHWMVKNPYNNLGFSKCLYSLYSTKEVNADRYGRLN